MAVWPIVNTLSIVLHVFTFGVVLASLITTDWNLCTGKTWVPIKKCGMFSCCDRAACQKFTIENDMTRSFQSFGIISFITVVAALVMGIIGAAKKEWHKFCIISDSTAFVMLLILASLSAYVSQVGREEGVCENLVPDIDSGLYVGFYSVVIWIIVIAYGVLVGADVWNMCAHSKAAKRHK